jgi:hypothetical protein
VRGGKASVINLNKDFKDTEVSARAKGFSSMLSQFVNKVILGHQYNFVLFTRPQLPDLDFPVNTKAEGRILVPWERRQHPNLTSQGNFGYYSGDFIVTFIRRHD